MPVAAPIVLAAAGSGLGAAATVGFGAITAEAFWTAVLVGAAIGALGVVLNMAFAQRPKGIAAGGNQDVQLTTYTQTGRIPVGYGNVRMGMNVIELGLVKFKQIDRTGQYPEQHLTAELVGSVSEGPCLETIALYADDEWQPPSKWEFTPGDAFESPFPFFEPFASGGINPSHKWLSKIHFNGDVGNRSDIPNFSVDLRGRFPETEVVSDFNIGLTPSHSGIDGPSSELWLRVVSPPLGRGDGMLTVPVPSESDSVDPSYAEFPVPGVIRAWKVGVIKAIVAQDPVRGRRFYFASVDATSNDWDTFDLSSAYDQEIVFDFLDDSTGRLHTLHRRGDRWFIRVLSFLTLDQQQYVIPSNVPIESLHAFTFKPEDNRYYFLVGGTKPTLSAFDISTMEWVDVAFVDGVTDAVGIVKLGIFAWIFYPTGATQIDTSLGTTDKTIPLSDFIDDAEVMRLGAMARIVSVSQSASRYMGFVTVRNDVDEWTVSGFYGPRDFGEPYMRRVEFRRYATWAGNPGRRIDKPGADLTVPFRDQSWITTGLPDPDKPASQMIAGGADYKTSGPLPGAAQDLVVRPGVITFTARRENAQGSDLPSTLRVIYLVDPNSYNLGYWRYWQILEPHFFTEQPIPWTETPTLMIGSPQSQNFSNGILGATLTIQTGGLMVRGPFTTQPDPHRIIPPIQSLPPVAPFTSGSIGTILYQLGLALAATHLWYPPQTFGWSHGGQIKVGPISNVTYVAVPAPLVTMFPRDCPLLQFVTTQSSHEQAAREIATAIKEPDADDLILYGTRVTVSGLVADNTEYQVSRAGEWASWNGSTLVSTQDGKALKTSLRLNSSGLRHLWWLSFVTPASESVDMLTNSRYGTGQPLSRIDLPAWFSLHGYSLEFVRVGSKKIRRYLWTHAVTQDQKIHDFLGTVLGPALAYDLSSEGPFSVAFESSSVQPVMEFDRSLIKAGSFSVSPKSLRTMANRVRSNFWNANEARDDQVTEDDEMDQAFTGVVRESLIDLTVISNPDRATFVTRNILESPQTDRQVFSWTTGSFARILSPGLTVAVTHPLGHFKRKPVRLITVEDLGDEVRLEAQEISPYTVDGGRFTAFRSPKRAGTGGTVTPKSSIRDVSIERFYGRALMPFRPVAYSGDHLFLLGAKAPASQVTSDVVAPVVPSIGPSFDSSSASSPRSAAITATITGSQPTLAFAGLYAAGLTPVIPCDALLIKRPTIGIGATIEKVRVTTLTNPIDLSDAESPGSCVVVRASAGAMAADTGDPVRVYVSIEDPDDPNPLEPLDSDGQEIEATHWQNPGLWTDVTAETTSSGSSISAFVGRRDFLVIGIGSGLIPNSLKFELTQESDADLQLIFEYSVSFDATSPLGVWKPLTVLDGTKGFTQSGRVHFEIPPFWSATISWDRNGNTIARDPTASPLLWIRIQRRAFNGSSIKVDRVRIENLPTLVLVPTGLTGLSLPASTAGQLLAARFLPVSPFALDPLGEYPGNSFIPGGGSPSLSTVTFLKATINGVASELSQGDTLTMTAGHDVVFTFKYSSRSVGWGRVALGTDVYGQASDAGITGAVASIVRKSDAVVLRTKTIAAPDETFTYTSAERTTDANVDVYVRIQQTGSGATADILQVLGDVP